MNFGSGSAKWRDTGAPTASPHLRGKKVVALAATVSVGASLFGLTTLSTTPAGAAPVTTSWNDRCVPHPSTSSAAPKNQANSITVDAPTSVTQGTNFTVKYTFPTDWYPDKESGATVGPLARLKRDFRLPTGTSFVSGSIDGTTSAGLSGVTPNVLQVDDSGNPSSTGSVIRLSGDNFTVGNGPKSATNNLNGIQVPRGTVIGSDAHTTVNHFHYKLPDMTLTLTATGAAGSTIDHTLRNTGNAALIDKAENPGTSLARASLIITVWTYTHCVSQTSPGSGVPGGAGLGTLASTLITAAVQNTTTSLSAPGTATIGQSVSLSATVTAGVGTPTGTVQFKDGLANIGSPVTLSGGTASLNHTFTTVGSHSITAVYSGDTGFNPSTSSASAVNVGKASPTTSLTAPGSATVGQSVSLSATVTGGYSPTGTVQFKDGGSDIGSPVALSGNSASMSWSFSTAGNHSITAVYSGDTNNNGSTSAASVVAVGKANSSTSLSAPPSANLNQSVTLSASVTGSSPTGTVQFKDGGVDIGSPVALSGNSASMSWSFGAAGNHSITAVYSGDANNNGSTSAASVVAVAKDNTSTSLSAPSMATVGVSVTLSATVTGSSPTGTVQFKDGGSDIGSPVALSGNSASMSWSFGTAGNHFITAVYSGDANNNGSTSTPSTVTVSPATYALSGTVTDESSNAIAGATVQLRDSGAGAVVATTTTDGSGNYSFNGVAGGSYRLFSFVPDSPTFAGQWYGNVSNRPDATIFSVSAPVSGLNIALAPAARIIRGAVQNDTGSFLSGVVVQLRNASGSTVITSQATNGIGRYNFGVQPAGSYTVVARDDLGTYATTWYGNSQDFSGAQVISLTNAGATGVDIDMAPVARAISGTVTLSGGGAAAGATVDLRDGSGLNRVALTVTDGSGNYSFAGLAAGTYRVYFRGVTGYDGIWFDGSLQRAGSSTIILSNGVSGIDGVLPAAP